MQKKIPIYLNKQNLRRKNWKSFLQSFVTFTFYLLQRCEMKQMESDHQSQLEGISLELMHFESSLRTKENQIDTMLATKDQVSTFTSFFKREHAS